MRHRISFKMLSVSRITLGTARHQLIWMVWQRCKLRISKSKKLRVWIHATFRNRRRLVQMWPWLLIRMCRIRLFRHLLHLRFLRHNVVKLPSWRLPNRQDLPEMRILLNLWNISRALESKSTNDQMSYMRSSCQVLNSPKPNWFWIWLRDWLPRLSLSWIRQRQKQRMHQSCNQMVAQLEQVNSMHPFITTAQQQPEMVLHLHQNHRSCPICQSIATKLFY